MAQTDCVGKIQLAIKRRNDVTALACETYMRMFDSNEETLVEQVRVVTSYYRLLFCCFNLMFLLFF